MKYLFLLFVAVGMYACQGTTAKDTTQATTRTAANSSDPCAAYKVLSGEYDHVMNDGGSIVWNGELTGSIEFVGSNFNEMTCTYTISDCVNGGITMICDGSKFDTRIILEEDGGVVLNHSKFYKKS